MPDNSGNLKAKTMQSVQTAQDIGFLETAKQIKKFALLSADKTFSVSADFRNVAANGRALVIDWSFLRDFAVA